MRYVVIGASAAGINGIKELRKLDKESEIILEDAKRNASRIINESLLKAEKADMEAEMLKRNINIFKRKLRGIIEAQLEMVDDIEQVEF